MNGKDRLAIGLALLVAVSAMTVCIASSYISDAEAGYTYMDLDGNARNLPAGFSVVGSGDLV